MKKILNACDLVFLRIIPAVYFVISLWATVAFSVQNRSEGISVMGIMTDNVVVTLCFLLLGCASVFGKFISTEKVAAVFKYIASGVAAVYILGYVIKLIWVLSWGVVPAFFGSVIEWQDEVRVVACLLLIVCCFVKDKFYKLKWVFTILCALLFFVATYCLPMVSLMAYNDPLFWRLMINSLLPVYCSIWVVVTGLMPIKKGGMTFEERKSLVKSYLGKMVDIKIDRPIGYVHKKENYSLTYPVNYGYIPGVLGGDGEELDVYLLGVSEPATEYTAQIIGIAHRENDVEDKLIAAPVGTVFYQHQMAQAVHFQEQYYKTTIEAIYEKSAGAVVYTLVNGEIQYLLIRSPNGDVGFPKGHIEFGETEEEAALREIYEETSIKTEIVNGFQETLVYTMPNGKSKTVVYFVGKYENQIPKHNEGFEDNQYMILSYEQALAVLTFDNTKEVLEKADLFLRK